MFLNSDHPADIVSLVSAYPDFLLCYHDIMEFRRRPKELVSMYSEALALMDRNMEIYMVEELQKEIEEMRTAISENKTAMLKMDAALSEKDMALSEKDMALSEKDMALSEKDMALSQKDMALSQKNAEIIKKDEIIAALREQLDRVSHDGR